MKRPFIGKPALPPANPVEHVEQVRLFEWARLQAAAQPELRLLYAIPNGGARHKAVAGKLKAEGVKRGVPDVCLPVARGRFHGLYVEMKRQKGGTVSDDQKRWHTDLRAEGYEVVVAKGWEAARQSILGYLALPLALSGSVPAPAVSP